jgi:hypothetical protein
MKKTYKGLCKYVRWGIGGMLSLVAALPALASISAAI